MVEVVGQAAPGQAGAERLDGGERARRGAREPRRERLGRVAQRVVRVQGINRAVLEARLRIDGVAEHQPLLRPYRADASRQVVGGARIGAQPERDVAGAQLHGAGREDEVGAQGQTHAGAADGAADGGDHRYR